VSVSIPEDKLPLELTPFQAVEAAYPAELARATESLVQGLPVLIEAEKELTPFVYKCLRDRLKPQGRSLIYLDGRQVADLPPPPAGMNLLGTIVFLLREVVRGAVGQKIVVLPHLDLLTSPQGGLTSEGREVIPLLYENPELCVLGFKDPSFPVPQVIENLFPRHESLFGVPRDRLSKLVCQRESRKLSDKHELNAYRLYKSVSGVNAVRLRRLLTAVKTEDYPADIGPAYAQLRAGTLTGALEVPEVSLANDIGGYDKVKERLKKDIIDLISWKDGMSDPAEVKRVESLIPRGMIFWGPPGTGKTLFAKAMATSLGAAVTVVSGPELKSKWVGESEENLRRVFARARAAAPAVIVFDELDSFAVARGTYQGSGVEHSMVNQLLTEMDGFRKEELVFVVGTTNFVESLDPALLRPGRFEFHLHIPFPDANDRRAILSLYDQKLGLAFSEAAMDYAVKRTGDMVEGQATRYSGDHLQALCRSVARSRLREKKADATEAKDIEAALEELVERPQLSAHEEKVVATHEAGHAVCAMFCKSLPPIDRISIRGDLAGALGFVSYSDPAHKYVITRSQLRDQLCALFGGREAELLLCDDLSVGSAADLERATEVARALVERFGMGGDGVGAMRLDVEGKSASEDARRKAEGEVREVLTHERMRAQQILESNKSLLISLRDLLLEKKVLDRSALVPMLPEKKD
jgi:cell division protease FtsH